MIKKNITVFLFAAIISFSSKISSVGGYTTSDAQKLLSAIKDNNLYRVKNLIKNGISPNSKDHYDFTALMYAAKTQLSTVKFLIKSGADVNSVSAYSFTALKMATVHKKTEIVKYLTIAGANLDEIKEINPNEYQDTIKLKNQVDHTFELIKSYKTNRKQILKMINAFGKQNLLELIKDSCGNTLLHHVILNNDKIMTVILLGYYPELVEIKNNNGFNPIQLAVGLGKQEILKFLSNISYPNKCN